MKEKNKALLHILAVFVTIVVFGVVAAVGIGSQHKGAAKHIKLGLDLAGGVSITYEAVDKNPTKQEMSDTIYKLQKRVENYSTESAVYQQGDNQINVDIPGVKDANKILKELGNAGSLTFLNENQKEVLSGDDIKSAEAGTIQNELGNTEYVVDLILTDSGKTKFAKATKENIGKVIYIVYDKDIVSAPTVKVAITDGKAQISGQSSFDEAEQLASTIRIGALPLQLTEVRSNVVGAKLGVEALRTSLLAGVIGFVLVLVFMLVFYRIAGLAADIALTLYVAMILLVLNAFDVTLTLSGIAGIILSIGMAVDANVIIFTRIKEELGAGKTLRSAIQLGFHKALSAIVDGNLTTLIAAAILYFNASGTIKGFAQTLAIGVVLSMFTALTITKLLVKAMYSLGLDDVKYFGVQRKITKVNFLSHIKIYFTISIITIVVGIGALFVNKGAIGEYLNYGLEFKGGTSTEITFDQDITTDLKKDVEDLVKDTIKDSTVETSTVENSNTIIVNTKVLSLDMRTKLENALVDKYKVSEDKITSASISGSVSSDMRQNAVVSVIIAAVCMLLYIWVRFKDIRFGASAVIALLHDLLVVFMVYSVFRIPISNSFIACMLTILGFSINATIIIFDRIRENKKEMSKKTTNEELVNLSINQTLTRCINTNLTTCISIIILCIIGVDSVKEFTIPLVVGIVFGAYSSICITGPLWFYANKVGKKKKA
jgi:SecD/SecF fusion protein